MWVQISSRQQVLQAAPCETRLSRRYSYSNVCWAQPDLRSGTSWVWARGLIETRTAIRISFPGPSPSYKPPFKSTWVHKTIYDLKLSKNLLASLTNHRCIVKVLGESRWRPKMPSPSIKWPYMAILSCNILFQSVTILFKRWAKSLQL